jgi:hypothetical protein
MKNRNMAKKTLKKQKKVSRKSMKGGFWPFTSSNSVDTSQPQQVSQPVKKGFWESLFGSKKTDEHLAPVPAVVPAPVPVVPAPVPVVPVKEEVVVEPDNIGGEKQPELGGNYRGQGGKRKNTKKNRSRRVVKN